MRPAAPTVQQRILDHFGETTTPAGAPATTTAVDTPLPEVNYKVTALLEDDDYLYFPAEDSAFLITIGAEADDTARRLNRLQEYTTGLLKAINQLNNLKVNPSLERK